MILSDSAILAAMDRGEIIIDPFDRKNLGGNSYDVHLSEHLATYNRRYDMPYQGLRIEQPLDAAKENDITEFVVGLGGIELLPGRLYLASTVEYTETHNHVPYLDGRSSAGRLGISIHVTAGRGDVGFCNHWTMELTVVHPTVVYAGMRIGQLTYHEVAGEVLSLYGAKANGTYGKAPRNPKPVPSGLWKSLT